MIQPQPAVTDPLLDSVVEIWRDLLDVVHQCENEQLDALWSQLREVMIGPADQGLGPGLRSKLDASDIVQQSLLDAFQGAGHFSGSTSAELRAWLLKIVEHNLADAGRQFRVAEKRDISREVSLDCIQAPHDLASTTVTASVAMRRNERDAELGKAISGLSRRHEQIIELRHKHGMNYAAIGVEMGISEAAARQLWKRAINALRTQLTNTNDQRPRIPR